MPSDDLSTLKLRGAVAFAARCGRRIFPVIASSDPAVVDACDRGIAVAEAFAEGELGSYLRAREVEESLRRDDGEDSETYIGDPGVDARHCIYWVARAGTYAFSAVTRSPPSESCCRNAIVCVRTAERRLREVLPILDTPGGVTTAESEIDRDLQVIRRTHMGETTELGDCIDVSPNGPLGPLWEPTYVPEWYVAGIDSWRKTTRIPDFLVLPGHRFRAANLPEGSFPDFLCWHINQGIADITASLDTAREESVGRVPPVFIVYAPQLTTADHYHLVRHGAAVYSKLPGDPLENADAVCATLREEFREAHHGWHQQKSETGFTGFWRYVGARNWPYDAQPAIPSMEGRLDRPLDSPASEEDYPALVAYLRKGWQTSGT